MHISVYLPPVIPLLAAPLARPLAHRLDPRTATWLLSATALILATASSVALGLIALAGLIRIPLVASLGHWSRSIVERDDPTAISIEVMAGAILAGLALAVVRMVWQRCRAFAAAAHEARHLPGDGQLVVMDDATPEAYALPGLPGRIVVSTGMLGALDDRQREVLVAHERAHLTCHHYAFVAVAQLAATANPLLRPLAAAVGYTVERWADECAATANGDRRLTAHAIATAALAASRVRRSAPALTLGLFGTRSAMAGAGPVPRRVAALLAPPPVLNRRRLLIALALIALAAATSLFVLEAAFDLHALLEIASTKHSD